MTRPALSLVNRETGVRERILSWLDGKATDYLVWRHETEWAQARVMFGECPDCSCPIPFCDCESSAREDRMMDDAFDAGYERAMERECGGGW